QTKHATGNLQPKILFTDADPAMQKIKPKLQSKWDTFINDFYVMCNSLTSIAFECCWTNLINKYPEVQKYFERVLYPTKTCWAYAFTKGSFSANTHSTQHFRVELKLKDEAKYSQWQEFWNMNPTTGIPGVRINELKDISITMQNSNQYNEGFLEDDYEEPQILINMALEDCSEGVLSEIWE
ncbi:21637_t:CDS:2, partial [Racocetra persica]